MPSQRQENWWNCQLVIISALPPPPTLSTFIWPLPYTTLSGFSLPFPEPWKFFLNIRKPILLTHSFETKLILEQITHFCHVSSPWFPHRCPRGEDPIWCLHWLGVIPYHLHFSTNRKIQRSVSTTHYSAPLLLGAQAEIGASFSLRTASRGASPWLLTRYSSWEEGYIQGKGKADGKKDPPALRGPPVGCAPGHAAHLTASKLVNCSCSLVRWAAGEWGMDNGWLLTIIHWGGVATTSF